MRANRVDLTTYVLSMVGLAMRLARAFMVLWLVLARKRFVSES
jgi:hypothetical protein